MRIAINHTQSSATGGSERYIWYLVHRLLEDGHEVHYVTSRIKDRIEHPRLTYHPIRRGRGIRFWKVLSFARASERALRRLGPFDVIHGFSKTWYQDVYTDGSGLQSVYREIQSGPRSALSRWLAARTPYQLVVEHCERRRFTRGAFRVILTMSRFVKEQIQDAYGLDDREVRVLYNGIDTEAFHPRAGAHRAEVRGALGIADDAPLVLFCGSDYRRKNLEVLLSAVARIDPGARPFVCVCGRDNHEERYRALAASLGIADRVRFQGLQPDIVRYFGASDIFCLPTRYDVFGMVALEAMACGVPVIVSAAAGASEVVEPGRTGAVLADPDDASALAEALRGLLPRDAREAQGRAAREAALRYGWPEHMKTLYGVYEEVARAKRGAS